MAKKKNCMWIVSAHFNEPNEVTDELFEEMDNNKDFNSKQFKHKRQAIKEVVRLADKYNFPFSFNNWNNYRSGKSPKNLYPKKGRLLKKADWLMYPLDNKDD